MSTKREIFNYLHQKSISPDLKNIDEFSAIVLSNDLHISRSLASQYLNSYVKEGALIKITSRPVYFLLKEQLEQVFEVKFQECEFDSVEELLETIMQRTGKQQNFSRMIGHDASLQPIIEQMIAALKYPKHGLPVILYGEKGSGKSLLCKEMFAYGHEHRIFDDSASFIIFKILEDDDKVYEKFVGTKQHAGLLQQAIGGMLCLKHIQFLRKEVQQLLQKILEEGAYTPIGASRKVPLQMHLVFVLDEDYQLYLDSDLIPCFPVIAKMPNLEERYIDDKEELIISIFKTQAWKLHKQIFISKHLIHTLLLRTYKRNIDELKSIIEDVCARANSVNDTQKETLYIRMYQLPDEILLEMSNRKMYKETMDYMDILQYQKNEECKKLLELYDSILVPFQKDMYVSTSEIIKATAGALSQYSHAMTYNEKFQLTQVKAIEHTITAVFNNVVTTYSMSIPFSCCSIFAFSMYLTSIHNATMKEWLQQHHHEISICLHRLKEKYPQGQMFMEKINYALQANLEMELDDMAKLILMINLAFYNENANQNRYLSIVIAHGHSTASSMAEAANHLLGSYVFDAFDMPLDTSMLDIMDRLKRYIDRFTIKNDILLLVDMGSLEQMGEYVQSIHDKNIGIINHVSTGLALEVGSCILANREMEIILKEASEKSLSTYSFIPNKHKKDLVIFISDNGIKMANRMKELFVRSLPKAIDVEMITLSSQDYNNEAYGKQLSKDYNLLFITGICSSVERPNAFISLEEMITSNRIDFLRNHLQKYLLLEEIDAFTSNLIHNFSLENALNSLSILDAKKLLEFVEGAVNQMQLRLERRFYGNTIAGLYIHMCCMIERLVTKEPISNREDLDDFIKQHKKFIEIVKQSFTNITNHYGVELSISEISYLYDYIQEDKQQNIKEGEF